MKKTNTLRRSAKRNIRYFVRKGILLLFGTLMLSNNGFAQEKNTNGNTNEELLSQYVRTKGSNIIVFDASNIKQFWIDKSVVSSNGAILITTKAGNNQSPESESLKIQLANVNEAQDCKIEMIADTQNYTFSVLNAKSKILSTSKEDTGFIDYSVQSAVFHLEDTDQLSFFIRFNAKNTQHISIRKIILSFLKNEHSSYLVSPGMISFSKASIDNKEIEWKTDRSFSITGIKSGFVSKNKIILSDSPIKASLKIKNIGTQATSVSFGYKCCSKTGEWINGRNYPYKNLNNILNVISGQKGSNKIIVDAYPEWSKGNHLCLDAKEDMSDIPNLSLINGMIANVVKIGDNQTEITLDKPLEVDIRERTKIRVQGQSGSFLYMNKKILNPGEECFFESSIQLDRSFLQYSPKALSRGVYYVIPIILSYSTDSSQNNTVLIEDYSIAF